MKRSLRLLAAALAALALVGWLALGANRGWTRTSIPVKTTDPVTGIEGIEYQKRFVPGLELLGVSLLGAGLLTGVSFLFRNQQPTQN
jgi:hypothetical protein